MTAVKKKEEVGTEALSLLHSSRSSSSDADDKDDDSNNAGSHSTSSTASASDAGEKDYGGGGGGSRASVSRQLRDDATLSATPPPSPSRGVVVIIPTLDLTETQRPHTAPSLPVSMSLRQCQNPACTSMETVDWRRQYVRCQRCDFAWQPGRPSVACFRKPDKHPPLTLEPRYGIVHYVCLLCERKWPLKKAEAVAVSPTTRTKSVEKR